MAEPTRAAESPAVDHLAYQTRTFRLGAGGLHLAKSVDSLDPTEAAVLTNLVPGAGGGVDLRLGLTRQFTFGGAQVHSAARYYDPQSATVMHFWGRDTDWGRAEGNVIDLLEGGFSGNPLTQIQTETELGLSKIYVADSAKMRRAGLTSASEPIGLPKPGQPTVLVNPASTRSICKFDASDGSQAANWYGVGTFDVQGKGKADVPVLSDLAGPTTSGVNLATIRAAATDAYSSIMELAVVRDLTKFDDGKTVTDDDIIHLQIRMDIPINIAEIRVYLVCSPFTKDVALFTPVIPPYVPGVDVLHNTSAYMHVYTPSDFEEIIGNLQAAQPGLAVIRNNALLKPYGRPITAGTVVGRSAPIGTHAAQSNVITPATPGAHHWIEFGKIGLPVRRGDFIKVGGAGEFGNDWSTITAVYIVVTMSRLANANIAFDELYVTGGGNVDDSEVDTQPFDYRLVNFDTATGERSNPSDVTVTDTVIKSGSAGTVDAMRQIVTVTPHAAYGRGTVRQEAYRRGGSNVDNWYFVGVSAADGGPITDNSDDITALAAGSVEIDHDQPVTTVDHAGNTILNQPIAYIFGPIEGYIFGVGDPFRPGFLYWSKRDEPDHWPSANVRQVCGAGEELLNGGKWGATGFVFSRNRLYTIQVNLLDGSIGTDPTACTEGPIGRWAMDIGAGGIWFVARDAVRMTRGGPSDILSDALRPLFNGQAKNGYNPIDWTQPTKIRLTVHADEVWFGYLDTQGTRVWMVYSTVYKTWRAVTFGVATAMVFSDPTTVTQRVLAVGGAAGGKVFTHAGLTDDGAAIAYEYRSGALMADAREEKLLGDVGLWANLGGSSLTVQARLNADKLVNAPVQIVGTAVYDRYIFDLFGTTPQHAQSIGIDLSGSASVAVSLQQVGIAVVPQPDITMNRASTWQPLNDQGEAYLTGCWIDADTGGSPRDYLIEGMIAGAVFTVATLVITSSTRRQWFSWNAAHVDMVRIRPFGNCEPWMLFGFGWLQTPEPPRIAVWDSGFQMNGDTYYTGLDIECDTFGIAKSIECYVDNVLIATKPVTGAGRTLVHLTFQAGRGHIYRFRAIDAAVGLLYGFKWILAKEPGEQTNWNQNYTLAGTHADKWLKGILLECDTFGLAKTVTVEIDGIVVTTQNVTTTGRKVVQLAFPQSLGRVFRIYPTDNNPGRLYSVGWLFDEEPYQLTRYETQEQPDGVDDFHMPIAGQIAIKSTAAVTMQVIAYGQSGAILSNQNYNLPATAGIKAMISIHTILTAQKGLLTKYIFTSAAGFWLYQEESWIDIQPCSGGPVRKARVFGDDDLDPARDMRDAALAAARPGGSRIVDGTAPGGV